MNLDDLKIKLNKELELPNSPLKTEVELLKLLRTNSNSIIIKIKRSLIFEIICTIFFFFVFGATCLITPQKGISIYFGSFALLCVPFFGVLFYLLKKINNYANNTYDVKNNLTKLHDLIRDFCKKYFQFTMALMPIAFIFSIYLSADMVSNGPTNNFPSNKPMPKGLFIGFFVGYLLAAGFGIYKFTKWYIKKLYGNYLTELKLLISQL